jgi:hypothetical protein
VVKLFELKQWNLCTILAKYGIPPRVTNINDKPTSLSGKETGWSFSLMTGIRITAPGRWMFQAITGMKSSSGTGKASGSIPGQRTNQSGKEL